MSVEILILDHGLWTVIENAVERAYPREGCGLLVGERDSRGTVRVRRAVPTANVADSGRNDRFEVDPQARVDLERALREGGGGVVVGHFHSHPDGAAMPSATDRSRVFEPDLVWVILSVHRGRVIDRSAYRFDTESQDFVPVEIGFPGS